MSDSVDKDSDFKPDEDSSSLTSLELRKESLEILSDDKISIPTQKKSSTSSKKKSKKKKRRTKRDTIPGYDSSHLSSSYLAKHGMAAVSSSIGRNFTSHTSTPSPVPPQNVSRTHSNTQSSQATSVNALPPPAELVKCEVSSPPPENVTSKPVTDEDFMKIFFGKNNKKAFMPANTKRALLFDLLDHVDISKFGAKGDYFKSLQSIWSKKKMSKAKRGLYSLDLVFDDLLTIDNFVKNNQHVSRLRSSHSSLCAIVDAMDDCREKAKIDRDKQGKLAESLTTKGTISKHLHMKYVPDASYSWIQCPYCDHQCCMPLESQEEINEANQELKKQHDEKVRKNKLLPRSQQKQLRLAQRHQTYGCFCFQQHCHLNAAGRGCVKCSDNGGPTVVTEDTPIGRRRKCVCSICSCHCYKSFNANKMQKIKTLRLFEKRPEQEKQVENAASYKLLEAMNQAFSLPGKNKSKEDLLHSTAYLFAEKDCSRDEQDQLAQIVGKPSAMITKTQHIQNLDPGTSNARQYRGGLGFCESGADNMFQDNDLRKKTRMSKSPEVQRLNFESPAIISNTRKHITKKYIERLGSDSYFPSAEKRNYKSIMKKLQGKKKDETLVGIIVDSEPKSVEDAAKIALLCNEDEINT